MWMDLGLLKVPCGLMGSTPKNSVVNNGDGPAKRKTKIGVLGSRPKVTLKSFTGKRVLGQPKLLGQLKPLGRDPVIKSTQLEKGKAVLLENPKPNSSKQIKKKWVSVQPVFKRPESTQVKTQASFPVPIAASSFQDDLTASTSYGSPTINSPSVIASTPPISTIAGLSELAVAPKLSELGVGGVSAVGSDQRGISSAEGCPSELMLVSDSSEVLTALVTQFSAEHPGLQFC